MEREADDTGGAEVADPQELVDKDELDEDDEMELSGADLTDDDAPA